MNKWFTSNFFFYVSETISLLEACTKPAGQYRLLGLNDKTIHVVNLEKSGTETWIVVTATPTSGETWNYTNHDGNLAPITILTSEDVATIHAFNTHGYVLETDIYVQMMADGSTNPSVIEFDGKVVTISDSSEDTVVELLDGRILTCSTSGLRDGHRCGENDLPTLRDPYMGELLLRAITMVPRDGNVPSGEWERNRFTFTGSRYIVKTRLIMCPNVTGEFN